MDFCKALISSLEVKFLSFQNVRMKLCGRPYSSLQFRLNMPQRQKITVFSEKSEKVEK